MKNWLRRILLVICICVFGYCAFQLYGIYSDKKAIDDETEEYAKYIKSSKEDKTYLNPDWDSLLQENSRIVAWVYVPDCEISFPVVQGDNDQFYLTHTTSGEYNERGAIFLEASANPDFQNDNSIIYGHSVQGGGMFTDLSKYADQDFFNQHPRFYLLTPSVNYEVNVMTFAKTTDGSEYYTTSFGDFREETLNTMMSNALYSNAVDLTTGNLVTLSTCNLDYGFNSNQRYVLTGVLDPYEGEIEITD